MAKSRFEYVKNYELPDPLMPNAHIVVRVDGRGFHKFSDAHSFEKPNDVRALDLMNRAAQTVLEEFGDVVLAFGESDEFSFLMRRDTNVYGRRRSKLNSAICSIFTSAYVFYWPKYFPTQELLYPPTFDSRVVLYPGEKEVRDYFSWRQADTHINNLYNTCFWALVHDGLTPREANKELQGTDSKTKNELLFSRFQTNYNNIPAYFRKGSTLVRVDPNPVPVMIDGEAAEASETNSTAAATPVETDIDDDDANPRSAGGSAMPSVAENMVGKKPAKRKPYEGTTGEIVVVHEDIIRNPFWKARPWLLF